MSLDGVVSAARTGVLNRVCDRIQAKANEASAAAIAALDAEPYDRLVHARAVAYHRAVVDMLLMVSDMERQAR